MDLADGASIAILFDLSHHPDGVRVLAHVCVVRVGLVVKHQHFAKSVVYNLVPLQELPFLFV